MRSKRAIRDEKGASLVMVLILLLIGGLIISPLLGIFHFPATNNMTKVIGYSYYEKQESNKR